MVRLHPVRHWLMKSEPGAYSIDDLERDGTTHWDGVRNHQAKNFMRDDMAVGDKVLFYHSNARPPGVAGVAEVSRKGYPDHTAFDPEDTHYDPKSDPDDPTWFMVDITFVARFPEPVGLPELKENTKLHDMVLLNRSRLSVQPCERRHYDEICSMAGVKG